MLKLIRFYESRGIRVVKALNQYLWNSEGKKYLDFHTGHGVAFLGHNNPYIIKSVISQLSKVSVLSTSFDIDVREEMLDVLSKVVPKHLTYTYLLNSGSEAVELALKLARKVTGRKSFVALKGSFHGRTFGALSLTWNPKYRKPFEPLLSDVRFINPGNVNDVDAVINEDVAAVVVEVVQGEGGVNVIDGSFLKEISKRALEVGALFIVDEVQTGFGRTGRIWAHEYHGLKPDIMVAGKALGGGFPVSAVFTTEYVASKVSKGDHGSTYGGNPIACAAVKASTEVLIKESVPERALTSGSKLKNLLINELKDLRIVRNVKGLGLMLGVELRIPPGNVIKCVQEHGVITLKAGTTVIRMLPPYMINEEDITWGVKAVSKCIKELNDRITHGSIK